MCVYITEKFSESSNTYITKYMNTLGQVKVDCILPIELKLVSLVHGIFYTNHHYDILMDQMDVCIYFSICFSSDIPESYYDFNKEILEKYRKQKTFLDYKNKSKLSCKVSTLPFLI
jgi:hypothetical protein